MSQTSAATSSRPAGLTLPTLAGGACVLIIAAGIVLQPTAAWSGLLIGGFFGLTLALGATLFAAINAVSGARWCDPIDIVPSVLGRTLLVPAVALAITFLFGLSALYPWANTSIVEASHLLHGKTPWLNVPFFLARAGIILLVLIALTYGLFHRSPPAPRTAALFLVLFAVCISIASWDWMMSLEPEWFSTMYGVYGFTGAFQGGIAAVIIVAVALARAKDPRVRLGKRQLHDLGSLLFGFSVFWAYIWFCQYMLIWYANLPEETPYFARRLVYDWQLLFWLNPILNFVIPFVVLLSSRAKRNRQVLLEVAAVVVTGRWLDTYLMVAPALAEKPEFPLYAMAASVIVLLGMLVLGQRHLQPAG